MSRTNGMASDLGRSGAVERDTEQAITALKKGAYLLKYGRRGKPKFCPFRLSNDESVLIWFSGKEEKHLRLSHVSRIISGQRTPIFQRYPRPEKEYQSFSLIHNERSLDLICKDKDEAEVWFTGLKALISRSHHRKWRTESRSDGIPSEANSPRTYTQRSSPLNSPFGSNGSLQKDSGDHLHLHNPYDSPPKNGIDKAFSDVILYSTPPKGFFPSDSATVSVHSLSSGGSDSVHGNMKAMVMDAFRVSLSSAVSSSSQGSGHDDGDALGDVFLWGEGTGDGVLGSGTHRIGSCFSVKMDSLLPTALESAVVLDVQNIACGGRHAALVTKQGEIFSWGEESGGRLGHGVDSDVMHPKLIEALCNTNTNIELVACGEYHTCAVTLSGDLYTWGDGIHNYGLLGHGNEVSHWVPKRVNGPLEGIHVSSISCGPWHTAVVTSAGQLFTFGDGVFGALGHGDRKSVSIPREVDSLKGLRVVRAACGVWHTAAVVEVMVGNSSSSNCSSGKLFTWGDGDKGRLGHGDKEAKLVPTCVAALVEPNFCQVACGHSLTVALTTSGHVYTMGSPVYGQLGSPQADGKHPTLVEGKLSRSFVEEIACGAYHVAVLTSKTEVYTWGKAANGRLGHGDTDDRNSPTLVEALKDKQVKSIACGTNFTAAICLHKWVSGVDQSMCSGCRLPFNFKRKRHNCYNCGLVFCHSCSSKKSLKASMAPNPNKTYRVCDTCFNKLKKANETESLSQSYISRRSGINQGSNEFIDKDEKLDSRSHSQLARFSSMESLKQVESRSKRNKKLEFNSSRVSPVPNGGSQWGARNISKSFNPVFGSSKKFFSASVPGSRIVSRATSPISRRPSPPRSTTPTPTLSGLMSPKIVVDDAKRTNDGLSQEVIKLRAQVENLTHKAQLQEVELERTTKQLKEAIAIAGEETAKCKAAKEVIKSLTAQLKDMAERLPVGASWNIKSPSSTSFGSSPASLDVSNLSVNRLNGQIFQEPESVTMIGRMLSNGSSTANTRSSGYNKQGISEATVRNGSSTKDDESRHDAEWVEQEEPGVYITLTSLPGGRKDLKRVRFSRKRFSEKQAEQWWAENRARVYEQYNVQTVNKSSVGVGNEDLAH
ncbi:PH, RCC1 and FYVE domains-containing protein 1-like isoform X1 [Tripterygium wilfordii]|uniref:PH, RCC1 and FYVE domains-containing protein 1-like isoform X1 n=1 Tax=Tripterygium wilfordii TaxID=458696 RepID=UPI0018F846E8|nr:PH, RCC1 and FYVE domains-containing protein 1-like isoform X1 [Tripterygium wilfordii]XP_038707994.1 PH, RCC1 and FYVE domains-containing protein 1-like isoform X1 [Tripterygium wilfordii]XP_038707995.1 PH, RCC1 and FYVE domains-containing protein 1-like isoform X1 [Tripterygium wilfordii]XP_038707996.1 PH, RCC1 and FYVE domains-containing protein 1-like isoform X1 [Tripterygium wilfordii]XP_038707998.1 PH, RCC1 and FYVE domains-containing protein 1-like isoform X1 [Tripterygium wilfordii]